MNSENKITHLEIFELGLTLAKALGGDKEAIADVGKIASLHPEMFENLQDVIETIDTVIKDPEIIIKNPRQKNDKDFIVAKKLNEEKMADIGIRNNNGTNVIFHANKKRMKNLENLIERILKGEVKMAITGGDAHTPHTPRPAGLGANVANANSVIDKSIIPQDAKQKQATEAMDLRLQSLQNILSPNSRSSIDQKEKAFNELELLSGQVLNPNQRQIVEKLQLHNQDLKKGVRK